jgi:predicted DNA-binding transcriptional regulator AlpA
MAIVQKPKARKTGRPKKVQRRFRKISARFMTTLEFADLIGVTTRTIQRRTRDRDIAGWPTPVRITPTVLLYERADVERFLQEAREKNSSGSSSGYAQNK